MRCPKWMKASSQLKIRAQKLLLALRTSHTLKYFWLLDNLRGLASLSVVVFHYKHFYFSAPGALASDFDPSTQPFYSFLKIFYNMGYNAVQLFFVISGFVFFFVYYKSLCDQKLSGFHYFVVRFSRLYPLHAATLLIVALGQWNSIRVTGQFTVYPYNDFYHFVLQLFFASHWGLQLGESFNGPVWSLSLEVVVYFVFYVYASQVATLSSKHLRNALIAFGVLLIIWRASPSSIGEIAHAAICFFAGGLIFFAWKKISSLKTCQQLYVLTTIGVGGCCCSSLIHSYRVKNCPAFHDIPRSGAVSRCCSGS